MKSRDPGSFPVSPETGIAACLFVATLALFWPATGFEFLHLDDTLYVPGNPIVAGGLRGEGVRLAFTTVYEQWWLPLLWISYMADMALFGPGPHGHHLVNVLLHAANAALLFWALFRLTGSRWPSAFAAALFAWHPTRVEAVAWIAARKDVLSGLFFMLALLAYGRHVRKPSLGRMAAIAGLMLAGLMAKAILVVLPAVLLLLDFWPLRRAQGLRGQAAWKEWRPLLAEKWPLFALTAVFMAVNLWTHKSGRGELVSVSLPERLGLMAPNVFEYLRIVLVPVRLNVVYPENDLVSWPASLAAALALAGITLLFFRRRTEHPAVLVGWLWFGAALLPVLRGVRLGLAQYADRWTYLPLIGLGIALAWSAAEWAGAVRVRRRAVAAAGLAILAACWARTPAQLAWWRNSLMLFPRAVRLAPTSAAAHVSLGNALFDAARLREAETHLGEATRLHPWNDQYRANWGLVLAQLGRADEAREALGTVWRDFESMPKLVHGAHGMASLQLGEYDDAIRHLEQALEPGSGKPGYRVELIRALFESGEADRAREQVARLEGWPGGEIRAAADLFPYYRQRWQEGAHAYAWTYFRRLAEKEPDNAATLNNVAWLAATAPDAPEEMRQSARAYAQRAVELTAFGNAPALDTLAAAQAACGDFSAAAETSRQALALAERAGDEKRSDKLRNRIGDYEQGIRPLP